MGFFRRRVRFRFAYLLACLLLLQGTSAFSQGLSSLASTSTPKSGTSATTTSDPLKRETPRSSMFAFLEACHSNDFALAAQYLDLKKIAPGQRLTDGPELAKDLGDLLNRNTSFEVARLSNSPEGNLSNGLNQNRENLASFRLDGRTITLQLEREAQQGVQVWLVSADSVLRIPELMEFAAESPIEQKLPAPLVETKFIGTSLWVWIALALMALVLAVVSQWLSRLLIKVITPFAKRYANTLHAYRLQSFVEPVRLLVAVIAFRAGMEAVPPSALARDYLLKLMALVFVLGAASFAMRLVDVVFDHVLARFDPRQRAVSYSVISLGSRFAKICIFCAGVLWVLAAWGYNTTTILAGVGVGGLAVALAAQKTIENLFGGLSVIFDRPVLVGDFCQFGGQVGTVEDIGLRSTRIRTLDRTVVTIPNSSFSTMNLENFSRRDRIWFHPTLSLRRDTKPEDIQAMMDAVTKILTEHPLVDASGVPVRFTKINPSSFDLEIFAYVLTADSNQYLNVQSELLLKFLNAAARLNVGFAVPLSESLSISSNAQANGAGKKATEAVGTPG